MLTEEALILLATLGASGLLVLGVLDLIWPTNKARVRRVQPAGIRPKTIDEIAPAIAEPPVVKWRAPVPVVMWPAVEPPAVEEPVVDAPVVAEPVAFEPEPEPTVVEEPVAVELESVSTPTRAQQLEIDAPVPAAMPEMPPEMEAGEPEPDPATLVDRCRELTAEMRYGDAVAGAMAFLQQPDAGPAAVVVALWIEVATARDRMGDRDAALEAFRAAVNAAPESDRDRVRLECAWWAATTTREVLASVPQQGDRYTPLSGARAFAATAREITGTIQTLETVRADVEREFWPAYEGHVRALVTDRDYAEAYRLATEALSDGALPPGQRSTFEEFRTATLAARIVALADRAVLAVDEHREWEAVGALERAETLLRSESSLPVERRDEACARVAVGYARLGRRRAEAAEFEEALDPLGRALRLSKPDAPARDEARSAMVKALIGVVDARIATIRDVGALGNRDSAAAQAEKLWVLLRSSMAAGVPQEPLTSAIAATRRLIEEFGGHV